MWMIVNISGCVDKEKNSKFGKDQIITVTREPLTAHLLYAGIVQPLKAMVVTTPAEGVVEDITFHYGDVVKAQQPLFMIVSDKFQTEYKNALMQYIKAKTDFINTESQFKESEFLHKNQLISDDDYKGKKTNYFTAKLSLIQAKDALATMMKQLDIKGFNFEELTVADIDKISVQLHQQEGSQKIHIVAPAAGVVLLATKEESDLSVKISKGSQVKQGDMLAMIGDVSGLNIHINVNEFNINQLKIGQKVKVSGTAFSQFSLEGYISGIDRQAQLTQGNVPVFAVEIVVPTLTPAQQSVIHIGMSAKVQIDIESPPVVSIPLSAIYTKNNVPYVKMQDQHSHKVVEVPVQTGQTTEDRVVIESPLKAGDTIFVHH
jgi:multidrug efflux pump subunit AcrA (membrane-fusion protein)